MECSLGLPPGLLSLNLTFSYALDIFFVLDEDQSSRTESQDEASNQEEDDDDEAFVVFRKKDVHLEFEGVLRGLAVRPIGRLAGWQVGNTPS